ncbi:TerB family tellurite resistance protein [Fulvivirga lutimaris]|uniref:TerB family tellurite resistance protein n=1 Tax=Fulvivirga lutimaris TaxID=1819566 RepID=UPI0012BC0BD6|nr:TerB family tellurite resistance protein [Fulvivirga lutimaris]MTI40143.1 TerB family tellurite resistance protein [Fulvivirga lutimaris]
MDIITRKQLNILIQLAVSDKHFSNLERDRIYEIARKKGFPQSDVKELIINPEPIGTFGALSDNQKFEYLFACIDLMLIDQKIFETELNFCKDIAIKLGFKKNVVEFMRDEIYKHQKDDLQKLVLNEYT